MGILTTPEVSPRGQTDRQTHTYISVETNSQSSFIAAASLGHAREPAQLEEGRGRRVLVVGEELPEQRARPGLVLPGQHSSCSRALGDTKVTLTVTAAPRLPLSPQQHRAVALLGE